MNQVWWYMPVIPELKRLRQEDYKFEGSLGYIAKLEYYPLLDLYPLLTSTNYFIFFFIHTSFNQGSLCS
jgi:hypothetical protein